MTWQSQEAGSNDGGTSSPGAQMYVVPPDMAESNCNVCLPDARAQARPAPSSDAERELVMRELQLSGFNITRTAQALKVSRVTFYRMLRRNRLTLRQELVLRPDGTSSIDQTSIG